SWSPTGAPTSADPRTGSRRWSEHSQVVIPETRAAESSGICFPRSLKKMNRGVRRDTQSAPRVSAVSAVILLLEQREVGPGQPLRGFRDDIVGQAGLLTLLGEAAAKLRWVQLTAPLVRDFPAASPWPRSGSRCSASAGS